MIRVINLVVISLLASMIIGCSSKDRRGPGDGNIPLAKPGAELADINFGFDSADLDTSAQGILRGNSRWLLDNPDKRVTIEGHCDERGTSEYNMALGLRRAESVYQFLRNLGVKESQLSFVSYGEEVPLDPASNESAWAKNRRAHFSIR